MEEKIAKGKSKINMKLLIALVLLKEWGYKLNAWKILKLRKKYDLEFFNCAKSTLYKYSKFIEQNFDEVKRGLKGTQFLEEY
ncbi:MAG: hypothetical protein QW367_02610 [Candidatus Aenigmatarchaeota archaeon]